MRLIITLYALLFYHLLRLQLTPEPNRDNTFDVEEARRIEGQRRPSLLGDTVGNDCSKNRLRRRARRVFVDPYEFERWWLAYRQGGIDALLPDWQELSIHSRTIAFGRYQMLGVYADREFIDSDDIRLFEALIEAVEAGLRKFQLDPLAVRQLIGSYLRKLSIAPVPPPSRNII